MSFWRPDDLLFINIIILNYCQLIFQGSSCEEREHTTEVCPIYVTQSMKTRDWLLIWDTEDG